MLHVLKKERLYHVTRINKGEAVSCYTPLVRVTFSYISTRQLQTD